MLCPKCNKEYQDNWKYCKFCGYCYSEHQKSEKRVITKDQIKLKKKEIEQTLKSIKELTPSLIVFARDKLPKILMQDEKLISMVQGETINKVVLLIATDIRLILVNVGFFKDDIQDFYYKNITSLEYHLGTFFCTITFVHNLNTISVNEIRKNEGLIFANSIKSRLKDESIDSSKLPKQELTNNTIDKLERLASLKEKGMLTEEEFNIQKKNILES